MRSPQQFYRSLKCIRRAVAYAISASLLLLCFSTNGWSQDANWQPNENQQKAVDAVDEATIRAHVRFLADDLLEGRGPGSRGDDLSRLYLATQLQSLGIQPGASGGEWVQSVPLVGITTSPPKRVNFINGDKRLVLEHSTDMMAVSGRPEAKVSVEEAELVFVGYGIQAPEYGWDDFKDVDVTGKMLVVMNNDPADDPNLFAGRRRLYYGRWDYKYEMAAKMGAAGALIIHTTESAGYPYQVVQTSWSGEEFELASKTGPRTSVKGWLTEDAAKKVMRLAGKDLDELRQAAQERDFRPVSLGVKTSIELDVNVRKQTTGNVIGVIPGTDPEVSKEHVVFMAHHDHLGKAKERDANGDDIYNGAIDNASGSACLLNIAKAIANLPEPPRRSIMFAFVGAEEQGLLGSKHMAANPPIPAGYMAAVVNIDGMNHLGKTFDLNVIGDGKSDLDQIVSRVAKWQERTVVPDINPDRGYYYRSDQFSLAQVGVPGVYLHSGVNVVGKPEGWGKRKLDEWVQKTYHQPSDEYEPSWDLAGAVDDVRLLKLVGLIVADQQEMPKWLPGDEFEAARKEAIAERN